MKHPHDGIVSELIHQSPWKNIQIGMLGTYGVSCLSRFVIDLFCLQELFFIRNIYMRPNIERTSSGYVISLRVRFFEKLESSTI